MNCFLHCRICDDRGVGITTILDVDHTFAARLMALTLLELLDSGLYFLSERKWICLYLSMLYFTVFSCAGFDYVADNSTAQDTKI